MATDTVPKAALGFRTHSGWASAVALGGDRLQPRVIDRRRLELCDGSVPVQPFHAAEGLPLEKAEKLLERCASVTKATATASLQEMLVVVRGEGYEVTGGCLLLASGRQLGSIKSTLASHALIHTAEGQFFRQALREAATACAIAISGEKERDIVARSARSLRVPVPRLEQRLTELGRDVGPPWRQDEKLAALAAWLVLAGVQSDS